MSDVTDKTSQGGTSAGTRDDAELMAKGVEYCMPTYVDAWYLGPRWCRSAISIA